MGGWMGHALDFPSENQDWCPVCDQESGVTDV